MPANEKQIRLAAKMYEMRDTAKRVFPELYAKERDHMTRILKHVAERDKCSIMQALITLGKEVKGDAITVLLLTAAAVEMMGLTLYLFSLHFVL